MSNYEEILEQSQTNIRSLHGKLNELENLNLHIQELIKQPEILSEQFKQIVHLSEQYTNDLGVATKIYLDGNNTLFTAKLAELDADLKIFKKEISRFQSIDLEEHFDKHQKTLSEIFNAVNGINLHLTNSIQTLTSITQSIGNIQLSIDRNAEESRKGLSRLSNETMEQFRLMKESLNNLSDKTDKVNAELQIVKKEISANQKIQMAGIALILIAMIILFILHK